MSEKNAVMGHSMGGGAAFLAGASSNEITALLTLAPAETNPSAISAAAGLSIPALIIAGENDCVTPVAANQIPMYQNLLSECKTYLQINGGSHCQMADANFLCGIGEATCSPGPEIDRETQHQVITKYLSDWLTAQLYEDCSAGTIFDNNIVADADLTYEKTCVQCNPLAIKESSKLKQIDIAPNPFSEITMFESKDANEKLVTIYDSNSRQLESFSFTKTFKYNGSALASGLYFYTVANGAEIIAKGKLVKN